MAKYDYNVIVIGAGSAGLVSSYIAAAANAKVALIERDAMGGDCLNTGCVPSKALLRSASIMAQAKRAKEFGLGDITIEFDFAKVMEHVQQAVASVAPHDSVERYTALGVDCITGEARIVDGHHVDIDGRIISSRTIIVATGARPNVPSIKGLAQSNYFTSDTIWTMRTLPKDMVVLGGGAIGCELAQAFARFGANVTIVERGTRILSREDIDVSDAVSEQLRKEGVTILTEHEATAVGDHAVTCTFQGKQRTLPHNALLLALGRTPNVSGFGLDEIGVALRSNNQIHCDAFMRTNVRSIYVCGDVTGPYQFTHMAAHQAWYAAMNALFAPFKRFKVNYDVVPWAVFTDPEVARVGLSETDVRKQRIAYDLTHYPLSDLDRALADSEAHGFVKVLTRPGKGTILGAVIVGHHASDMLAEFVLAMTHGLGMDGILSATHSYPTYSEGAKAAAGQWKKANLSDRLLSWSATFHKLRR